METRHIDPMADAAATAPYNFVPLPRRIFTVEEGLEAAGEKVRPWLQHDRFVPGTHHGWIDLTLETLTPLFIRGPVREVAPGKWDEREARERREPCMDTHGRPVIPGSGLRGMVRTLVEILSFSKIQPVTDERPFFRTVGNDHVGSWYRALMMQGGQKPSGGFLRIREGHRDIIPVKVYRVEFGSILPALPGYNAEDANYTPSWTHQQQRCFVQIDHRGRVHSARVQDEASAGNWTPGTLVLSGAVKSKKREFVFLNPCEVERPVTIPDHIWERFHDEDQLTQWQERAFPQDQPAPRSRAADGHLRDGEPVFFLCDESLVHPEENPAGLVFLGRPQMFRLPYDMSPRDLVPETLRNARLDLAEALFGRVQPGVSGPDHAIKGRLRFEDATATGDDLEWTDPEWEVVLSSPKPTTYPHYLTQDSTQDKKRLTAYLRDDRTAIRGHKLYWHRNPCQAGGGKDVSETQKSWLRPVKARTEFESRIWFENLTEVELGALLAALELPGGCAHKLGQGKPLGLGSVRLRAKVTLVDPAVRYRSWGATGECDPSERDRRVQVCRERFSKEIARHARESGEVLLPGVEGLSEIARLDALFRMLSWEERPKDIYTRALELGEFRDKRVLPSPHAVFARARGTNPPAIDWTGEAPVAGQAPRLQRPRDVRSQGARSSAHAGDRDHRADRAWHNPRTGTQPTRPTTPAPPSPGPATGASPAVDPLADLRRQAGWFSQRTRGNLSQLVGKFEAAPPSSERARLAREVVQRAETFRPPLNAEEQSLVQRLRGLGS